MKKIFLLLLIVLQVTIYAMEKSAYYTDAQLTILRKALLKNRWNNNQTIAFVYTQRGICGICPFCDGIYKGFWDDSAGKFHHSNAAKHFNDNCEAARTIKDRFNQHVRSNTLQLMVKYGHALENSTTAHGIKSLTEVKNIVDSK